MARLRDSRVTTSKNPATEYANVDVRVRVTPIAINEARHRRRAVASTERDVERPAVVLEPRFPVAVPNDHGPALADGAPGSRDLAAALKSALRAFLW
jgi:hypothetical protein